MFDFLFQIPANINARHSLLGLTSEEAKLARFKRKSILQEYKARADESSLAYKLVGLIEPNSQNVKNSGPRYIWPRNKKPDYEVMKNHYLSCCRRLQNLDKKLLSKLLVRCMIGGDADLPPSYTSQLYKEDIRKWQIVGDMNILGVKVGHFVQAVWTREYLEMFEAMKILRVAVEHPGFYDKMKAVDFYSRLNLRARTNKDVIGYRYWFFDIDRQSYTLEELKAKITKASLGGYLSHIIETSTNKFHVYFKAELEETAHWNPFVKISDLTKANRVRYSQAWKSFRKYLNADVGESLLQKAQAPGYINPNTGCTAKLVYQNPNAVNLTLQQAHRIVQGVIGSDVGSRETLVIDNKFSRPIPRSAGVPTLQEYLLIHGIDEFESYDTINHKVKLLTRYLLDHVTYPFCDQTLENYYQSVILPAFNGIDSHAVRTQWEGWVKNQADYASRRSLKIVKMREPSYELTIDQFLAQWLKVIEDFQNENPEWSTEKRRLKHQQYAACVKKALMDPDADCLIDFESGRLIGKIPCKYLKGPENLLGRYNELTRDYEKVGFIHRNRIYKRPYKTEFAIWAGQSRTWIMYLTPQKPQVLDPVFKYSYNDYTYWMEYPPAHRPPWWNRYNYLMKVA